ncbi:MAG: hypothetical protein QOK31_2135 [Solirubrobacteraceae bacterium]|jgi:hypothetical protein|nr:hypothetical protein [Solirubrobacteraceae bacterium]
MRRLPAVLVLVVMALLVVVPEAVARNYGGQGLYGETNDKSVTNAGFIVIAFFPLFIATMSLVQWRLEKRKYARTAAKKRRESGAEWRGGW